MHIIEELINNEMTIATMESCTAGLISSMITDTEGASTIFPGGYVTYSNEAKVQAGVDAEIIDQYGVYSAECAEAMAQTAKHNLKTRIGIGITGTTGNVDTNNHDSVEGVVYYSIAVDEEIHSFEMKLDVAGMERHEIKQRYADEVFAALAVILQIDLS